MPGGSKTERPPGYPPPSHQFPKTRWSVVAAAADGSVDVAAEALEELCRTYWFPLYAYIRRRGHPPSDAEDLTQGFFASFLRQGKLHRVDRDRGRFRSYLITCLKHFLANQWHRSQTLKRGCAFQFVTWDATTAEQRYLAHTPDQLSPDALFDKSWIESLLESTLNQLREDYQSRGSLHVFDTLSPFLTNEATPGDYDRISTQLQLGRGATRMALARVRRRFGETLRRNVAQTVTDPSELVQELRYLVSLLD